MAILLKTKPELEEAFDKLRVLNTRMNTIVNRLPITKSDKVAFKEAVAAQIKHVTGRVCLNENPIVGFQFKV